jgi:hypothetical protein
MISASAPVFVGIWTFIQWFTARGDKNKEREMNEDHRREEELEKERHEIIQSQTALLTQLRVDIDRYRKIIEEKNTERWYAWDRARFWHQLAWDMRNEAGYARQIVESYRRLSNEPQKPWEVSLNLPPFDGKIQDSNSPPPKQTA